MCVCCLSIRGSIRSLTLTLTLTLTLGVCAAYLLGDQFEATALTAAKYAAQDPEKYLADPQYPVQNPQDPSFYEMSKVLCNSDRAAGWEITCPRDGKPGCALVDALHAEGAGNAGEATHFLSWCWGYHLDMFRVTLRQWLEEQNLHESQVFVWICFFWCAAFIIAHHASPCLGRG